MQIIVFKFLVKLQHQASRSNKWSDVRNMMAIVIACGRSKKDTNLLRAPPGRLGSTLIRFPAISHLFNAFNAASAARTS